MKTVSAKPQQIEREWFYVDAAGKTLGRLSTAIAHVLRGKHKAIYTPHVDTGDHVVVLNADKINVTGNKMKAKMYHRHSGYPGGLKSMALEKVLAEKPERVIETAVRGMLPKNPLGRAMFRKLKVYVGTEHPHTAQQPKPLAYEEEK
jgi:large subunit ribosomal protein L13